MKGKIKNNLIIFFIFSALLLFVFNLAEARQGCCSHHGGVCGCGCCDRTSLSATCAPYYPQCSESVEQYNPPVQQTNPQPTTQTKSTQQQLYTQIITQAKKDSIKKAVEDSKTDYYKNPDWFREKLIENLTSKFQDRNLVVANVYSILKDIK